MLEFILSKTILIIFSLAVLIATGSMLSSFYAEQEMDETGVSFQQIVDIVRQADSFGGENMLRLEMKRYLGSESVLQIGNGSMLLRHDDQIFSANLSSSIPIKVLDDDGLEVTVLNVVQGDILEIERRWENNVLRTVIYIEKVDATFSTAITNRSASSTVL